MDNQVHALGRYHTDLDQPSTCIPADQHDQIVEHEDTSWVAVGMEHVIVSYPVLASTVQDHGIHYLNLP